MPASAPAAPKKKSASLDMTQGSPVRLLILFALPMLIGGIFQLLYNTVDTLVVGRFVSTEALAAIGATSSTTMFIMFLGNAVMNVLSVIVSQAEGAKQEDLMRKAVSHAVYLVILVGGLLGLVAFFGARPFLTLLGTDPSIIDNSVTYVQIVCGLTIAQLFYNGASSILRAIGDSRTPLYFLIFSSLLNVGLDLLFVIVFSWGVAGVGFATVISQGVSAVLCILYMLRKYPRLRPDPDAWKLDGTMIREYVRIGIPMVVQSAVLNVGMFVITAVINSFGVDTVAAYTIGSRVEQLATVTFSNLAFSFAVYAGQNFGARRFDRIKDGLRKGVPMVIGLSLLSTLVMMLFADPLADFFMRDGSPEVLTRAVAMIRTEAAMYFALGTIWALSSTLRGMGAVKITLASSVVELASKIGFSLLLPAFLGYIGIWMAAPIGWVLGILPCLAYLIWWSKDPEGRSKKLGAGRQKKEAAQKA